MIDTLGDRMKGQYENRTRYMLPRRTYTIIRLDGKGFHNYTRGLKKPFDDGLMMDLDNAVSAMMPDIQGADFAYIQSDEVSILVTDFNQPTTAAWFDNNVQKMASVSASMLTAEFNKLRFKRRLHDVIADYTRMQYDPLEIPLACFDARVFTIPDRIEVMNYFVWRNTDCARNSISMVARTHFTHNELDGKSIADMHEMLYTINVNWAEHFTMAQKNGRLITRVPFFVTAATNSNDKVVGVDDKDTPLVLRTKWQSDGAWKFTENKDKLLDMIPEPGYTPPPVEILKQV